MPETADHRIEYRKEIDGLRALAVIFVIINHFNHKTLPGGYLGVDVFFVISGYVITSSLEKCPHSSLSSQLLQFYSRRIKRLMPALITMAIFTTAAIRLFDPDAMVSFITGITSVFGLSNIFLFSEATNYFGNSAQRNAFSHTWSLAVEEQFYLLYPFFILRWRTRNGSKGFWADRFRLGSLTALTIISFLLFVQTYRTNQPAAYFLTPFRFWELGAGCLLALITRYSDNRDASCARGLKPEIALIAIVPALFLADVYPMLCTLMVVIATALLIGSIRHGSMVYKLLSNRLVSYLGEISYSLYLWHWPIICISYWTIGFHAWTLPFQIALILVLAMASYHFVENPLRRIQWSHGRWGTIATGLPIMVTVVVVLYLGQKFAIPSFAGDRAVEVSLDSIVPGYVAKYSKRRIEDCFAATILENSSSSLQGSLKHCAAENDTKLRLIFVGDSHSTDLFPMAEQIYKDGVASVVNVSQAGCQFPPLAQQESVCDYQELIFRNVVSAGMGNDILVIRNNYSPRFIDGGVSDFSKRLESLLERTSTSGMKVIYFAPSPKYYSVGPNSLCSPQWFRPEWAMGADCRTGFHEDRAEQLARRRDVTDYLVDLSRKRNDFHVFDPFSVLCGPSESFCTPVRDGRLIYRDETHLTGHGSELLAAPFEAFLGNHKLMPYFEKNSEPQIIAR